MDTSTEYKVSKKDSKKAKKVTKVTVEHEETTYEKKIVKHKKVIHLPVFWKDEYGYILGSFDGKSTIQIGLNGHQLNKPETHSIKTHDYFDPSYFGKKSKEIDKVEFFTAVAAVYKYCDSILKHRNK